MVERFTAPSAGRGSSVQLLATGRESGEWVRYSDYVRLQEQLEAVTRERDSARDYGKEARLREKAAEDARVTTSGVASRLLIRAEAAEARAARLAALAGFLCDRLDEFDRDINDDADHTAYHGHVAPAKARLRTALSEDSVKEAG